MEKESAHEVEQIPEIEVCSWPLDGMNAD